MRTFEGQPHFTDASVVDDVWFEFLQAAILNEFEILAYCFMPDHLHILVEGLTRDANLKSLMNVAKQRAAHVVRRRVSGRLWQTSYYDQILRDRGESHAIVAYMLDNPIRAGLAKTAIEYPYLGGTLLERLLLSEKKSEGCGAAGHGRHSTSTRS